MKRLIPVILALWIPLACGKKDQPVPEPPPAPAPVPKAEPSPAVLPPSPEPATSDEKPKPARDTYVVVKGDTLYDIAKKHGVSYRELAKWNRIKNPRRLRVDQELRLTPPGK